MAAQLSAPVQTPAFSERYRQMFNRRGNDWWSIVFAYPLARLCLVILEPFRWVTPSLLTMAGFLCKAGAAAWILSRPSQEGTVAIALLLQLAQVLDSMDGTLARRRQQFTRAGALLDKATDAIGFAAVAIAIGHRAAETAGDPTLASLGGVAAAGFVTIGYIHWVVRASASPQADAQALAGAAPLLGWSEIRREWLRGWARIARFGEADNYLWLSLLLVLGRWRECVYFLAVIHTIGAFYLLLHQWIRLRRGPNV